MMMVVDFGMALRSRKMIMKRMMMKKEGPGKNALKLNVDRNVVVETVDVDLKNVVTIKKTMVIMTSWSCQRRPARWTR